MYKRQDEYLNTKTDQTIAACVYPYWHPGGEYIAYSTNNTRQSFHTVKDERVEVLDLESDVVVYHPADHRLLLCDSLQKKDRFETFPAFSPDGRTPVSYTHLAYLLEELHKLPGIKEIRGRGLMIGIEFEESIKEVRSKLLFEEKVFTGVAGTNTIRLLPPLCLTMDEAKEFIHRFKKVLNA